MNYLYDIWVNWFDGEEEGINVCAYHEWRKQDNIQMIDQIPVLYIEKTLFHIIENSLCTLPDRLLATIYKKTYVRKGYGRQVLPYACIVTDGERVLAIDTVENVIPFRKSRLTPRQERQVYEMCDKIEIQRYPAVEEDKHMVNNKYTWQVDAQFMLGLTRRERKLKKILLICLAQLKRTENKDEISYWLSEWKGTNALLHTKSLSIDEIWTWLYNQVIKGWTVNHEEFLQQLIRGYPILKHEWSKEQLTEKNKENQKK